MYILANLLCKTPQRTELHIYLKTSDAYVFKKDKSVSLLIEEAAPAAFPSPSPAEARTSALGRWGQRLRAAPPPLSGARRFSRNSIWHVASRPQGAPWSHLIHR